MEEIITLQNITAISAIIISLLTAVGGIWREYTTSKTNSLEKLSDAA